MGIFFWIIDLLIPIIMVGIGFLFAKHPPKNINHIYGYRTKRSMASQEAWDFAHSLCGTLYAKIGTVLLLFVVVIKVAVPIASEYLSLVNMTVGVVGLIAPIPVIEKRLKEEFGE